MRVCQGQEHEDAVPNCKSFHFAGGEKNKKKGSKELEEAAEEQSPPEIQAGEEDKQAQRFVKGNFLIHLVEAYSDFIQ